jgi:hypothetical protein
MTVLHDWRGPFAMLLAVEEMYGVTSGGKSYIVKRTWDDDQARWAYDRPECTDEVWALVVKAVEEAADRARFMGRKT